MTAAMKSMAATEASHMASAKVATTKTASVTTAEPAVATAKTAAAASKRYRRSREHTCHCQNQKLRSHNFTSAKIKLLRVTMRSSYIAKYHSLFVAGPFPPRSHASRAAPLFKCGERLPCVGNPLQLSKARLI
jgi:hypothetical protein